MTPLATAIERRDWERTALYLLIALNRAAERLPPETLTALLDLLSEPGERRKRDGR